MPKPLLNFKVFRMEDGKWKLAFHARSKSEKRLAHTLRYFRGWIKDKDFKITGGDNASETS